MEGRLRINWKAGCLETATSGFRVGVGGVTPACTTRVLGGDRAPFGILAQRYERAVLGVALWILGDYHSAQDVAQDALVTPLVDGTIDQRVPIDAFASLFREEGPQDLLIARLREQMG